MAYGSKRLADGIRCHGAGGRCRSVPGLGSEIEGGERPDPVGQGGRDGADAARGKGVLLGDRSGRDGRRPLPLSVGLGQDLPRPVLQISAQRGA